MNELRWERFIEFNGSNATTMFEKLCRIWFETELVKEGETTHSDPNHPGIEIAPVQTKNGEMASFQAIFFENGRVSYSQFEKSLNKLPLES